ncbi:MAG TPA: SAM-dependent chlorinase/fluorinase [Gemmatimonadales bacterium]|nr:SAM-dependent chlorinase/fluorinase [Gemmatimonadales bacterium]
MSRPLITLLTDFGTADSYVAEVKAALLRAAPQATLVDLTHAVPPGDLRAAAYLLGRTWHRFPEGTVHLAVVDPGVGTPRAALAFGAAGHWFVGPDNGLFTPVLRDAAVEIVTLAIPPTAAPTFHGRDLFAPAAAALASGTALQALGQPYLGIPHRLSYRDPHYEGKSVVGEVVYVDRFGTLVTNLTPEMVPDYAVIEIEGLDIGPLRRTFGDVPTGGLLAYLGSGGQVEIAVRDGSAARRLGMGVGGRIRVRLG